MNMDIIYYLCIVAVALNLLCCVMAIKAYRKSMKIMDEIRFQRKMRENDSNY